ncbi:MULTISPECIES: hypothetical protein [Marinobacter]|uniref:hypothetical protein n=1 Tax=Marinobacter TaxID=2742 RepID=UPI0035B7CC8E
MAWPAWRNSWSPCSTHQIHGGPVAIDQFPVTVHQEVAGVGQKEIHAIGGQQARH